jgi:glucose/arabinose dehydrogenase
MAVFRLLPAIALTAVLPTLSAAQLRAEVYVSGLSSPVAFVQAPGQSNVQLVIEQAGRIRVIQDGALRAEPFLDISAVVGSGGERGLLGLVFAPDYATSRRFWVNFTNTHGHTVIARFLRNADNPLGADAASRFDLVFPGGTPYIAQPFANHNGGDLHFGADGYLYIAMGDGGSSNDPGNLAQDMTSLHGKMLRIDVNAGAEHVSGYAVPDDNPFHDGTVVSPGISGGHPVRNLVWSLGWRNPWRFTFDSVAVGGRGAMVVGDVGQNAWEEANYEPAGRGGRNYGWRIREGAHPTPAFNDPRTAGLTDPILEYSHAVGNAITGGPVYRGTGLGLSYFGDYFFADLNGRVWSASFTFDRTSGDATNAEVVEHTGLGSVGTPVAFGTDGSCRVYIVDIGGRVLRLLPSSMSTASTCAFPDPFLALGGGVWTGDGWVPPPDIPAPAPSTPPAPTLPPAGTCVGADPFAGIPGISGVCVGTAWVPAGHPLTLGVPPAVITPAPPTPPPGSCTGPDPFAGIPGLTGVCVGGGWVPANHPLSGGGG